MPKASGCAKPWRLMRRNTGEAVPDTQWPRYYVFEQPRPGAAFIHAGSVHAPDDEMAVLYARDVFSRRPDRLAMWVVRDKHIYSKTREELADRLDEASQEQGGSIQKYFVFQKKSQRGVCTFVGNVQASSPEAALAVARHEYANENALVWWIVADANLVSTDDSEREALFDSAVEKPYRHERHYPVHTMMREIRRRKRKADHES